MLIGIFYFRQAALTPANRWEKLSEPERPLLARLLQASEQRIYTGHPTYPVARTLLTSGKNGEPTVLDKEPEASTGGGLFDVARVWPLNAIVIHLTILGIIYCLAKAPIFGRAKELPSEASADFGKHVTALGQLMARSKDRAYAEQRIAQYQQQGKRKSGKSHLKGA